MTLEPGLILNNRYRVLSKLGQGGMGAVYLAVDLALDRQVAVKANRNPAPDSANKFLREARLLASLRHPHLPRVTDYFILDGVQYLVMDYIAGPGLDALLWEQGPQPIDRVLEWANQLGSAISFLHQQTPPVIHRDIKPANVRLSPEGEAVLVDFGIARVIDPAQSTTTSASGYTPGYAPPEQYTGSARTGPFTDQYAFAALLYHLLTGQKPVDSVQRALGQARMIPIRELRPEVPAHMQAAIEKAMALKPEDRFAQVDDLLRALTTPGLMPLSPVSPPPAEPTLPARTVKTPPPPRRLSPWVAVAVLLAAASLVVVAALVFFALGGFRLLSAGALPTQSLAAVPTVSQTLPPTSLPNTPTPPAQPSPTPPPPSETPQPAPTDTLTPPPTDTPTAPPPSPTSPPLGGGGLVAFASDRAGDGVLQIWTMRVALNDQGLVVASDFTQLTHTPGDKTSPVWSPDGRSLLYVAPGEANTGLDIWRVNADGSGAVNLTNKKGDDTAPAWSPDGQWIAFTNNGREDRVRQVYMMRPDGTELYRLSFDQEEFDPAWSPDMKWLGFVMNAAGAQIMFLRPPTDAQVPGGKPYYATPQRFDRLQVTGNLGQVSQPAWSPDGNWLVYTRQFGKRTQIFLARYPVQRPDQDVLRLTDGSADRSPAWSPDSQWIVYTSEVDGNAEIYIMRSTGQLQVNLTNAPGQDLDPDWQKLP